jgi:superfamily I DNA/RNA helicase
MANLDDVYDADHRTAAFENHQHGLLVCLAGPGTGKTYSLLERTAALAAQGCDVDAICYLTFIKEISNAFGEDYIEKFGLEFYQTNAPRISTLHSFACSIVRNQGFRIGYDGDLFFANVADSENDIGKTFLADLLAIAAQDGCHTIAQLREKVNAIKKAWRDRDEPNSLPDPTPAILQVALNVLRCFRLIDWDQAVPLADELLDVLDEAPQWIQKIRHYFVDEYQDFNRAEQALIHRMSGDADSVVIVGDDDQSLYSGRGGSPEGMRSLYDNQEHDRVSLTKCYRCRHNLINPANTFQAKLSEHPRPMVAAHPGGQVVCHRFKSSKAEVAFLTDYLNARIAELPEIPKSKDGIVCLFPNRRVLNCYYDALSHKLPCARRNPSIPPNRLWLERVLQLIKKPHQRFLERLLLNEYTDLKPRHRRIIIERMLDRDLAPSAACESLLLEAAFTGKAVVATQAFCSTCGAIASPDPAPIAALIALALGLQEAAVIEQVRALIESVDETVQDDLLATICDKLLPDTIKAPDDPHAVLFLTMHGSKGLTKKTVAIPGLEEAWLPGPVAANAFPERQRLFYVAISRATDELLLTLPHNRGGNDSLNFPMPGRGEPSSFIASAGLAASYHE